MTVDPKTLLKSLTRNATVALEHAVAAAIAAKQVEVTVEHVLLDLLDDPGSDVALVLAHHAVDAERVRASLARSLDELRSGSDRRPTLSAGLLAWMQDAWQATCSDDGDGADGGYVKLRSGALLARVVVDPGKYLASEGESPLRSISKADMQVGLAARLAPMPEEAEARGGPATVLLERTQRAAPRPTSAPAQAAPAPRVVAAPEAAPPVASKELLKLLTRVAMRALEAAATRSKGAGHHEVTVEHVVLELLDDPGGDAALLIARHGIDEAKLRRALERSVDELRSGADRPPVISKAVFAWMQDAWHAASAIGYAKLRSGALFARLVVSPAKYFAHDGEAPLAGIGKDAMTTGLAEQLASMPEEAEARGGEASPLLARTQRAAPRPVSATRDEAPPARTPSRAPSPAAPAETSRDLLKRLTRVAMRAFEAAASSSTSAGHHEITVEHVALELLDDPGGDVALLLAAHAVDPAPLRKALERSLDELRSGADRRPTMSPTVVAWMSDAWQAAGAPLGYTKLRSGALFARLIVQPAKYFADAARVPPLAIAKGGVTDGLAEQLAAMPEETEARGGEARPLADRTRRGVAFPASPSPAPARGPARVVASPAAPAAEDAPAGSPIAAPTLSGDVLRHLTGVAARALEAGTARSASEGHHEVIVEHVLLALLADADADAARLVAAYPVDARKLKKTLENNLDELRMGAEQPPVVADVVLGWMQDAWSATEGAFGKLRSGALLARLVVHPSRYFGNANDDPLHAIAKDDMQAGLAARLAGWPEDDDAGVAAPRPAAAPLAAPEAAPAAEPVHHDASLDEPLPPEGSLRAPHVEPVPHEPAASVDPMTRLSGVCARAFEAAAARAARMQHHEITVEHVVLALVDDDDSDVASILRARGLDADKLRGVLYRALDKLAYGGAARATHAARLTLWMQDAASAVHEARRLRSGDLYATVAAAPATYTTNGIGAPIESDAAALREIAATSAEAADA